ncbi:putative plant lipid transfer protein/Par allergen [Rosa chinensis]|uniref:Putative plant lipid transfer protein/Par allergen n=1 Tax=Rosa chinensis TaxID=74649 RepID=A0A2P6R8E4_ROSCH|nr:non-specific lipid-transfer protein 3 [Rosa chinensis]PRQ42706.1 putative plant lipid transfer protein/Par allergen [Rosa chinensis]
MASSGVVKVVCVVVLFMAALFLGGAKAFLQCPKLVDDLKPCIPYLEEGGTPMAVCCNGIKTIYDKDLATLQDIAKCLEKLITDAFTGTFSRRASGLPRICGILG